MIAIKEKTYDEQQYINIMNKVYNTRRKISIVTGVGLIVVGIATFPVPCGSVQMITAGGMLIFVPNTSFKKMYKQLKTHIITKIKMRKNFK